LYIMFVCYNYNNNNVIFYLFVKEKEKWYIVIMYEWCGVYNEVFT
jgi:hypothetical protein